MLSIKYYHVIDDAVKLTKKFFNDFDKIVQWLQLVVLQHCEKINKEIKIIIVYILNDFRRVYSNELIVFSAFNRKKI